jgi:hypothetical protein
MTKSLTRMTASWATRAAAGAGMKVSNGSNVSVPGREQQGPFRAHRGPLNARALLTVAVGPTAQAYQSLGRTFPTRARVNPATLALGQSRAGSVRGGSERRAALLGDRCDRTLPQIRAVAANRGKINALAA